MIAALRVALVLDDCAPLPGPSTRRLIARAKEFLEASYSSPLRLLDVAREVGASPAYLTDVFRRAEGVPLHGYLTQLRLARALDELASADDLTNLALDLGFSSHSHFTAVFRRWFGTTPSRFRREAQLATD
jgi:AraC-like DNA-binding protein